MVYYVDLSEQDEPTESECRHAALRALQDAFGDRYIFRTEFKVPRPARNIRGARLDLVVIEPATRRLILILEVKRRAYSKSWKQGARYASLTGVPVIYIKGMIEAQCADERVCAALKIEHPNPAQRAAGAAVKVFKPFKLEPERIHLQAQERAVNMQASRDKLVGGLGDSLVETVDIPRAREDGLPESLRFDAADQVDTLPLTRISAAH